MKIKYQKRKIIPHSDWKVGDKIIPISPFDDYDRRNFACSGIIFGKGEYTISSIYFLDDSKSDFNNQYLLHVEEFEGELSAGSFINYGEERREE